MLANVSIKINSTKEKIWEVITNIENSTQNIRAIEKIVVIDKPKDGFVGFKWKETRTMFGKEATEIMWVTGAETNRYYETRAESHGSVYISKLSIEERDKNCVLSMGFEGIPQSVMSKLMGAVFGGMMKKSIEKALLTDLVDIKNAVEKSKRCNHI